MPIISCELCKCIILVSEIHISQHAILIYWFDDNEKWESLITIIWKYNNCYRNPWLKPIALGSKSISCTLFSWMICRFSVATNSTNPLKTQTLLLLLSLPVNFNQANWTALALLSIYKIQFASTSKPIYMALIQQIFGRFKRANKKD